MGVDPAVAETSIISRFLSSRGADALLAALIATASAVFAGWNRPIWMDELLHFALGGMSLPWMVRTIDYTSIELNHGQTGAYMSIDWLLLQVFGANAFALRLPSLLSTALLFISAAFILRVRGFNRAWQAMAVVGLMAHQFLMSHTADARPYMPLAASAVAMIAFFLAPPDTRKRPAVLALGVTGLFLGATMHPYWILFLAIALGFSLLVHYIDGYRWRSMRAFIPFLSLGFVVPALAVYFFIGALTWLRRVRRFGYDPYEWIGSKERAWELFWMDHVTLGVAALAWLALLVMLCLSLIGHRSRLSLVALPAVLFTAGLLSSIAVTWLSLSRSYWIFERQWLAGIALCSVALVWLFAEIWRLGPPRVRLAQLTSLCFVSLTLYLGIQSVVGAWNNYQAWQLEQAAFIADTRPPEEVFSDLSDETAIYAANVNVSRGGDVWPEFYRWYRAQAGMRVEFRATNPSWSDWPAMRVLEWLSNR